MSGLRDALLCEIAALALRYGAGAVLLPLAVAFSTFFLGLVVRRALGRAPRGPGMPTSGPHWVMAALVCAGLYALGRIVDPLLAGRLTRPDEIGEEAWRRMGYFEWRLFGGSPILRMLLPLADQPGIALALHTVVWGALFFVLATLLTRFSARLFTRAGMLAYDQPEDDLPFYFRWVGATTARRADHKTRSKLTLLVGALILAHSITGGLLATSAPPPMSATLTCDGEDAGFVSRLADEEASVLPAPLPLPSPGTFVLLGLVLWVFALHLVTEGTPPAELETKKAPQEASTATEGDTTTERLRAALLSRGIQLEDPAGDWRGRVDPEVEGETAPPPSGTHPLFMDVLQRLVGEGARLHRHQAEVLAHLLSAWRAQRAETRGAAPRLEEAALASTFVAKSDHAHPLVLTAEGSGRTSLGLFAALLVVLDRGATAVVLTRRKDDARALGQRIKTAIEKSALRWNLSVAVAGDDLGTQLASGRLPHIVLADLETFESEILSDARTDGLMSRLGLLVVDDLDAFVGVPEMHLFVAMRRFWALSRTLRDAPYPLLLLALGGPSAEGMLPWARHLLATPLSLFEADTASRRALVHVRRRDLALDPEQASGPANDPTVADLASAAAAAKLRWHLRLAGDERRRVRRAHIDLEGIPGHVDDPSAADVVILEGRHPDVAREARRLVHAGAARPGEVVMIHAPPPDEDTVLSDVAIDSKERALTASLPRAVSLSLPALVRQRHFDRALGREHDVEALQDRFGRRFVDETLAALSQARRIAQRTVWQFDPRTDDAVPRLRIRSVHEAALGEPIVESTVGESKTRVALIDEGTAEVLTEVDGAIALTLYPPGAVLLAPEGRYQVRGESEHGGRRAISLVHGRPPLYSSPVRRAQIEASSALEWAERTLGGVTPGKPLSFCSARVEVTETLSGMRVHLPGAVLLERRTYERELVATYSTEACVVAVDGLEPSAEAPLLSAARRALPWLLRSAEGALDAEIDAVDGRRALVIFDRTPGGSGLARALEAELLGDALRLSRRVLERLVGSEMDRLRAVYDSRAARDDAWNVAGALSFLDGLLDGARSERAQERFGYTPGEGTPGDLGRVWIAPSGRTDDLSWVRHTFALPHAIGRAPAGEVSLDVGVERAEARRRESSPEGDALIFGTVRRVLVEIASDEGGADVLALHWVAGLPLSRATASSSAARLALIERRADADGRGALLKALAPNASIEGSVARVERMELDLSVRGAAPRSRG